MLLLVPLMVVVVLSLLLVLLLMLLVVVAAVVTTICCLAMGAVVGVTSTRLVAGRHFWRYLFSSHFMQAAAGEKELKQEVEEAVLSMLELAVPWQTLEAPKGLVFFGMRDLQGRARNN